MASRLSIAPDCKRAGPAERPKSSINFVFRAAPSPIWPSFLRTSSKSTVVSLRPPSRSWTFTPICWKIFEAAAMPWSACPTTILNLMNPTSNSSKDFPDPSAASLSPARVSIAIPVFVLASVNWFVRSAIFWAVFCMAIPVAMNAAAAPAANFAIFLNVSPLFLSTLFKPFSRSFVLALYLTSTVLFTSAIIHLFALCLRWSF